MDCSKVLPLLLIVGLVSAGRLPSASTVSGQAPFRLSVNVDLVVLPVTVRDGKGHEVPDLAERDFEVYEDGTRQAVRLFRHEDIPVTVGLVIDHSRSMGQKLPEVVAAARTFVHSSNPDDQMFVVNFNEKVALGLPPAISFTNRSEDLERAISTTPAIGMTALYDAVVAALGKLRTGIRDKKVLILISDGGDNASAHTLSEVVKMAAQSNAIVYAIGIFDEEDPDKNPGVLRRFANATGGEAYFPGRLDEVVEICAAIAHDIRNQYTIGYFSSASAKSGAYRAVRVVARAAGKGKLSVRTRSGYIADGGPEAQKSEIAK